ncbi:MULTISPECIES: type II secretion system protein M [Atlantibacter]|uniref:type II secretion system protein M n=1 Tax=Atlantibacter TaxID=1903434 RepID=UPI0022B7A97B|nr:MULTISPECIES: type II secretion system protein M [Atlantibacter]MCZ7835231.1 type II secretion system protein M [Atlantibacter hermannii]
MKQKLNAWFNARNGREKMMVLMMVFALLWVAFFYGIWLPLQGAIDDGKAAIERANSTQTWMQQQVVENDLRVQRARVANPQQAINNSLKQSNIPHTPLAVQGQKATVTLEPVSFAAFYQWYVMLNRTAGVQIDSVQLTPLGKDDSALKIDVTLFWGKAA